MRLPRRSLSYIAELIPDGATMQMGIGAIPDAVLNYLYAQKDLGVHSELFSDGVIDLVEAGILTSRRKSITPARLSPALLSAPSGCTDWAMTIRYRAAPYRICQRSLCDRSE